MWSFVSPRIVFGEGALAALDELAGERAFIVTDAQIVRLGMAEQVAARLRQAGMQVQTFAGVEPEPSTQTVAEGARLAREFAPDWIVGLGGGSAMDAAKAIRVLCERLDLQPEDINPLVGLGLTAAVRLVTIPTTSGTGAEATWAIVLTDTAEKRKMGLGNRENVADLAIVDPAMAAGMPPRLTADTGLDALTHAIEGYTCTWHTDLTDGLCLNAARLAFRHLPRAVADGTDMEARERMHNAAVSAGLGFGNAMASLAHAMGHALGAVFHLPHGRAVALALPYTIEFAAREAPERFAELADLLAPCLGNDQEKAVALATAVRSLIRQVGNPTSLAEAGIARDAYLAQRTKLVEDAANDTQSITAVRSPSYDELSRLFDYLYEGKPVDF